ncbi:putative ribonuclease H-like domain-containing protein [Tanacetum coccineum]
MVKPVWNNTQRVNHQNAKKAHPYAIRNMVPRAVLMKSSYVLPNSTRQVNIADSKPTINSVRPMTHLFKSAHSTVKRLIHESNPQMDLQDKGVIDSGCSRHMTGNMSYLTDYEEIDGGYVAIGGNPKGGKITGKGTIKTGNLDFENVYFVKELKFNLIDESQVLLRVPRKNNMYSVDLNNIFPKGGLTFLFAKATSDESRLWHRRLGHLNFKTMNKLVKGNLARGLPSKLFENEQTCVACLKGKQHKASSTKDETSSILKSFIIDIENLSNHKVKIIRCDNGTEFKNKEMNQFCEMKEAVNTACYVQNRVLVAKPYNKTPYELFNGRPPILSFMRPFGCPVTILNTIDHLGKFDGKADEGFFVRYSLNKKAFRVFNSRTMIMEENLHIRFSESTPNVAVVQKIHNLSKSTFYCQYGMLIHHSLKIRRVLKTMDSHLQEQKVKVKIKTEEIIIEPQDDPNMPSLDDNNIFDNSHDEGVRAKTDMSN